MSLGQLVEPLWRYLYFEYEQAQGIIGLQCALCALSLDLRGIHRNTRTRRRRLSFPLSLQPITRPLLSSLLRAGQVPN